MKKSLVLCSFFYIQQSIFGYIHTVINQTGKPVNVTVAFDNQKSPLLFKIDTGKSHDFENPGCIKQIDAKYHKHGKKIWGRLKLKNACHDYTFNITRPNTRKGLVINFQRKK